MTNPIEGIIKSDRRRRLLYSPEQKAALVAACNASGLSTFRFAAMHGVKYQTIAAWVQMSKAAAALQPIRPTDLALLSLVPAEIEGCQQSETRQRLELQLPGGATLAINEPDQIQLAAALIRELARLRSC